MRTARQYELTPDGAEREPGPRREWWIHVTETFYCEDRDCEATHDDPAVKWDSRVSRTLALAKRHDAERIVKALRLMDEYETHGRLLPPDQS